MSHRCLGPGPVAQAATGFLRGRPATAMEAGMERAREYFAALMPIAGTPGEAYLRKRALEPPYPDWIRWLPPHVARIGEGAVVALLTAGGVVTGLQLTFVTTDGDKSLIEPVRRTFL